MASGELRHPAAPITRLYGQMIRERREDAGYSQQEAAAALEVSQATMSRFERGEAQPDYATFRRMSELFGCKMSEVVPRNQYPSAPLEPAARREHMIRRNAAIQQVDPDEYLAIIGEQEERANRARGKGA